MKIKKGIYKRYKGNNYEVIGTAKHSETLEDLVVYKPLYENSDTEYWVRPISVFQDYAMVDGKKIKRFKFIK